MLLFSLTFPHCNSDRRESGGGSERSERLKNLILSRGSGHDEIKAQ